MRAYGLDQSSAEDVVQTTWLTLIRKSEQVRDDQAVLRWLTITARREAWRVAQSGGRTSPTDDSVIELSLPAARSPESEALRTSYMALRLKTFWWSFTISAAGFFIAVVSLVVALCFGDFPHRLR